MKMYYGFYNSCGIGMRHVDGGRVGHIEVFETKSDRDTWIAADEFDGNWHREAITSTEARRHMLDRLDCMEEFGEPKSYMERYGSMEEIVKAYTDEYAYLD